MLSQLIQHPLKRASTLSPHILSSFVPAIHEASPDADLFSLGLDSLLVFRATKSIRPAMGLQDQLAPRHLYGNPTLAKFSTALARSAAEARQVNGTAPDNHVDDDVARMTRMIEMHKFFFFATIIVYGKYARTESAQHADRNTLLAQNQRWTHRMSPPRGCCAYMPSLVHDAFTLLQSLPDYIRFTTACMGLSGMHAMIFKAIRYLANT